jgi:hypothetical protein
MASAHVFFLAKKISTRTAIHTFSNHTHLNANPSEGKPSVP